MQYNQASPFEFDGKSMEAETATWGRVVVEQILASEERNKPKRAGLWETVRNRSRKVNLLIILLITPISKLIKLHIPLVKTLPVSSSSGQFEIQKC